MWSLWWEKMWNGKKVLNWIFSLTTQNLLVAFKISVGASSILYGYFFGYKQPCYSWNAVTLKTYLVLCRYSVAVLFLSSCLVAFKLPILIVYFNQLLLGAERTNLPVVKQKPKFSTKPSSPYFLVEGGTIPSEVNEALERVRNNNLNHCSKYYNFSKFQVPRWHFWKICYTVAFKIKCKRWSVCPWITSHNQIYDCQIAPFT